MLEQLPAPALADKPETAIDPSAIPAYRRILKNEIPAHYLKPDNLHLIWLTLHIVIVGFTLWAMSVYGNWWLTPILSLVVGHSFGCMGFIAHEICHGGAIKNKKIRHLLACIAFSPFGIGAHLWSRWHNAEHHGHTQHPDLDPDRLFLLEEYRQKPILKWLYRRSPLLRNLVIFAFFSLMMTEHNFTTMVRYLKDPHTGAKEKGVILFQFIAPKAFWIAVTLMLGWPVLIMGYIVPLLIGNTMVISYISTNHFLNPLADENDVLASSLSVTLPKWLGWVDMLHSRFGAHVSHHLFPQAPSRYSRKIEEHIARLWPDRFHIMPLGKALKLLWQTPWVYAEDHVQLIDPNKQTKSPTLGNGL